MKKFKKLLAGLLTGAMLLGSMSVSAFAAGKTPVFDTTKTTGSITIHKYEYNETVTTHGTGETTDESSVPKEAKDKPLEGAGFTIYKVADVTKLTNYYSANPTSLPAVSEYVTDGKIKPEFERTKVVDENGVYEKKTDSDGIAKFTGLELGFYVVIETSKPDKVTTPVPPFLVSIPMTVKSGDNWIYDVNVYPKNKTTYGNVTLEKTGENNALLKGVTFVLQKKNGTSWTSVTNNESNNSSLNLTTNDAGQINVAGLSQGTYRFIETNRGANDGYIMDGATTYQFVVGADGNVKYGEADAAPGITITVKNEKPDMTKQVQKKGETSWGQDADYSVGDLVPYQITVSVPKNITKLKTFTLTDTPTNLDDKIESVVIKNGESVIKKDDVYTVTKESDNPNGFKITFNPTKMSTYAEQEIIVTYNAELLSTADTTTTGNPNTATLEYSNKILPDKDDGSNPNKPGTPTTDKIEDTAVVYTFQIQIVKKAESETGTPLAGVEFDLYKEVAPGTEGAASTEDADKAGLDTTNGKTWKKINGTSLITSDKEADKGKVSQGGLKNGDYYLVETKTNQDYNLLKAPVKVKLNIAYTTTTKAEYYTDKDDIKTLVKHEVDTTTFTNDGKASEGIQIQTVINKKGFTLPLTGGMGTVLFSVIGLALVLAGVVVITASRKKTAK